MNQKEKIAQNIIRILIATLKRFLKFKPKELFYFN